MSAATGRALPFVCQSRRSRRPLTLSAHCHPCRFRAGPRVKVKSQPVLPLLPPRAWVQTTPPLLPTKKCFFTASLQQHQTRLLGS